ncbi:HTH-type transcriptional regulator MhqR [Vibrio quintilis]|uniref:HTH-type transcriptional regulator MhqR n=2 Tax=Vibrio quintilis TaxID=1117707 RepID=A0A1M7Z2S9_9VIBR|nr:HTH-type transcriptional regulator MhqR [Vibrio quintilis]
MSAQALYKITVQTRRLYQLLRCVSDRQLEQFGINSSHRSLLEYLYHNPSQTVPQIADQKLVSRQHIQTIVNSLSERGLVVFISNPNHKRSSLVRLTRAGEEMFESVQITESALLEKVGLNFPQAGLEHASQTLDQIIECFQSTGGAEK